MLSFKEFLVENFMEEELPTLISAIKNLTSKNSSTKEKLLKDLQDIYGFKFENFGSGVSSVVYAGTKSTIPQYIMKIFESSEDTASQEYLEYCKSNQSSNPFLPFLPSPEKQPLILNKLQKIYIMEYVTVDPWKGNNHLSIFFGKEKFSNFIDQVSNILGGDVMDWFVPSEVIIFDHCINDLLIEDQSKFEKILEELFDDKFYDFMNWIGVYEHIINSNPRASLDFGYGNYGFRPSDGHMVIFDPLTTMTEDENPLTSTTE
jgi:hypothetical protein